MHFTARLETSDNGSGRWVVVPDEIAASFPVRRPPVVGTVNGVPFRSRLAVYGGRSYLGFTAPVRAQARIDVGDELNITLEADDEPRVVDIPNELAVALAGAPTARAAFDKLAFTHRKEYANWIDEAKRADTRQRRAEKAIDMLIAGTKTPR
jgi:hypothetical protein